MLKIKHPLFTRFRKPSVVTQHSMQFTTVKDDSDELTKAIVNDVQEHDDTWTLTERPDSKALNEFWDEVEDDIKHDPQWQKISESDA